MITFRPLGGHAIAVETGAQTFTVFPQDTIEGMGLLSEPEQEVSKGTISWPGEYDIQGVSIRGLGHDEGTRVSYILTVNDVRCAFLSAPLHDWSDDELESLGDVDILVVPTGKPKLVQKLVDEIDPRILIPLKTEDDATFAEVLKHFGAQDNEVVSEFKQKSLPSEGREVVVFG